MLCLYPLLTLTLNRSCSQSCYSVMMGVENRLEQMNTEIEQGGKVYTDTRLLGSAAELTREIGEVTREAHDLAQGAVDRVTAVNGELTHVKGQVGSVNGELAHVKEQLGSVNGELSKVKGEVADVNRDMGNVRGGLGTVRGSVSALQQELSQVAELNDKTKKEVTSLTSETVSEKAKTEGVSRALTSVSNRSSLLWKIGPIVSAVHLTMWSFSDG